MSTLVVVAGGKKKIWKTRPGLGPTKARQAYRGGPFNANREYAEKFADRWVVLSAKYGFLDPDSIIPSNYDVTFKDPSTNPINVSQLKNQIKQKHLDTFGTIVVLGGQDYADIVSNAFSHLEVNIKKPLAGLKLGYALQKVKNAVDNSRPLDC